MVHPTLTSLSQSMESMLSVQSTVGVQSPAVIQQRVGSDSMLLSESVIMTKKTAPSCDSGVETGGMAEVPEFGDGETRESGDGDITINTDSKSSNVVTMNTVTVVSEKLVDSAEMLSLTEEPLTELMHSVEAEQTAIEQNGGVESKLCSSEITRPTVVISVERPTVIDVDSKRDSIGVHHNQLELIKSELNKRRWVSTDLLPNVGAVDSVSHHSNASDGKLDRRWTSDFSLSTAVVSSGLSSDVVRGNDAETKVDDVCSIISDGSNVKNGYRLQL